MRSVVLGVSGILIAGALVAGRADAQVGFGLLGGTGAPTRSVAAPASRAG